MGNSVDARMADIHCKCVRCGKRYMVRDYPRRDGRGTKKEPWRRFCTVCEGWQQRYGMPSGRA